eukprot:9605808-Alexandrium_andersonii.AAC.1
MPGQAEPTIPGADQGEQLAGRLADNQQQGLGRQTLDQLAQRSPAAVKELPHFAGQSTGRD